MTSRMQRLSSSGGAGSGSSVMQSIGRPGTSQSKFRQGGHGTAKTGYLVLTVATGKTQGILFTV